VSVPEPKKTGLFLYGIKSVSAEGKVEESSFIEMFSNEDADFCLHPPIRKQNNMIFKKICMATVLKMPETMIKNG
jgi:hypothetical protein